jgi:hypothetical protein
MMTSGNRTRTGYGADVESRIVAKSRLATFGPKPETAAGFTGTMPIVGRKRRAVWVAADKAASRDAAPRRAQSNGS